MASGSETQIAPSRTPVIGRFAGVTAAVLAYPAVFVFGFGRWWEDPAPVAWVALVITGVAGAAFSVVLVASSISAYLAPDVPPARSLRQLIVCALILTFGIPVAGFVGLAAGLAGFGCSGGMIGEGCSGGSPLTGILVGGATVAFFGWIAWLATRPG